MGNNGFRVAIIHIYAYLESFINPVQAWGSNRKTARRKHSQLPGEYFNPLDLGRMVILNAGQKWYGLVLETSFEKSVVRRLARIAENAGILMRFIQVSMAEPSEKLAKTIVFLDFSNVSITPEEVLRLIRKQPFVKNAYLITPNPVRILYDNHFFPLVISGMRAVILRRKVYENLFNGIRERFGTARGRRCSTTRAMSWGRGCAKHTGRTMA
jgi:hypothetical protein